MSAYESLAACYDELTYDIPYEKILTFFERLCAREHVCLLYTSDAADD